MNVQILGKKKKTIKSLLNWKEGNVNVSFLMHWWRQCTAHQYASQSTRPLANSATWVYQLGLANLPTRPPVCQLGHFKYLTNHTLEVHVMISLLTLFGAGSRDFNLPVTIKNWTNDRWFCAQMLHCTTLVI